MSKPTISIDGVVREMNDAELAQHNADLQAAADRKAEKIAKDQAREAAIAKLAAIGLTTEDLKALGL